MSKNKNAEFNYSTSSINLSHIELTSDEASQFKLGLEYSFIESLESCKCEDFHELLRANVDIFTKNIHETRDNTYKNLKRTINDPNIAVVSGDKESCVAIMNRSDCFKKMQHMIDEGIENGVYIVAKDKTLEDLKLFRSFLYRNFKKYKH